MSDHRTSGGDASHAKCRERPVAVVRLDRQSRPAVTVTGAAGRDGRRRRPLSTKGRPHARDAPRRRADVDGRPRRRGAPPYAPPPSAVAARRDDSPRPRRRPAANGRAGHQGTEAVGRRRSRTPGRPECGRYSRTGDVMAGLGSPHPKQLGDTAPHRRCGHRRRHRRRRHRRVTVPPPRRDRRDGADTSPSHRIACNHCTLGREGNIVYRRLFPPTSRLVV